MDPTANLRQQLELAEDLWETPWLNAEREVDRGKVGTYQQKAERLCELVKTLDEWIRGGGVLPEPWQAGWRR